MEVTQKVLLSPHDNSIPAMNQNHPTISIDLVVDRLTAKEVLNGVLHTILFHRLFGTVKPKTLEILDVTLPAVSDIGMEQLVNERVDTFRKAIENGTGASKRGQILVTFSEKRPKKGWFQVYVGEEEVPWEQWIINTEVRQPKDRERQAFDTALSKSLTDAIQKISVYNSSERGRTAVPLITNASGLSPFPMKIAVQVGGVEL